MLSSTSLLFCLFSLFQPPAQTRAGAAPGDILIQRFQENMVGRIEASGESVWRNEKDLAALQKTWRTQLREMLGIPESLPRTDLQVQRTGTIDTGLFAVEKIVFQSLPGLYVTANLYLPKNLKEKAPGVLYVCGHGNVFEEIEKDGKKVKRSLGSKVSYRHHGAMLAEKGYVCLILDTLQLGEIEGLHHGTYTKGMFWWQSHGFTPGGVECWNAIRAIDFLQSLPQVDPDRIGVTGRSGGGATTWWVSAVDERVKCGIGVAGLADLRAHLIAGEKSRFNQGVITGHCDCMFMVNLYRWDYSQLVMLCAPRPMLLINTDDDGIFPVGGFRRPCARIADFYKTMGVPDRFSVFMGQGDHVDTRQLQEAAFAWLEKWLKPGKEPQKLGPKGEIPDWPLRTLQSIPENEKNTTCHEWFIHRDLPERKENQRISPLWWNPRAKKLAEEIKRCLPETTIGKSSPSEKPVWTKTENTGVSSSWSLVSDKLTIAVLWLPPDQTPQTVSQLILVETKTQAEKVLSEKGQDHTGALFLPGYGPMAFTDKRTVDQGPYQVARRLALLGTTVAGLQSRALIEVVESLKAQKVSDTGKSGSGLKVKGSGDLALVAAVASTQTEKIQNLVLEDIPLSWKNAPSFLGIGKICEPSWIPLLSKAKTVSLNRPCRDELEKTFGFPLIPANIATTSSPSNP